MKICSLLPSNTEIVFELGLSNSLVGVTHECDFPEEAKDIPIVTSSVIDGNSLGSKEIHSAISGLIHGGTSIYALNQNAIDLARPDLILTQELCDVCAVSYQQVKETARVLDADTKVVSLEPNTLWQILDNILLIGQITGSDIRAEKVVATLKDRIKTVSDKADTATHRPRVLCMEWLDPIFVGGHWIPEMVALAGGIDGLGHTGKPSFQVPWHQVAKYNPEIIILMPCGFSTDRTLKEFGRVQFPPEWDQLAAVESGNVYAVDGSSYFNRPGPRIVHGLEILGQIIQPNMFQGMEVLPESFAKVPCSLQRAK